MRAPRSGVSQKSTFVAAKEEKASETAMRANALLRMEVALFIIAPW
jgi:hypothetical protein